MEEKPGEELNAIEGRIMYLDIMSGRTQQSVLAEICYENLLSYSHVDWKVEKQRLYNVG
jgi:hypothetical protein